MPETRVETFILQDQTGKDYERDIVEERYYSKSVESALIVR